jgi:hypothetical protein
LVTQNFCTSDSELDLKFVELMLLNCMKEQDYRQTMTGLGMNPLLL